MAELNVDQADGLRRMFRGERVRVVHVVAGCAGVGRSAIAANLGLALARSGPETLLVDCAEAGGPGRALGYLGLEPRAAAAAGGIATRILPGPDGLAALALDAAALTTGGRDIGAGLALDVTLHDYAASLDFVLVSSRASVPLELLPLGAGQREIVVVLSRAAASITEAYALIKRLSVAGVQRRFQVLVNRVGSEAEAELIFRNMAAVAQGYLDVRLELLGFVPADEALERAAGAGRSVLESAPKSPAAHAFRRLADVIAGWRAAQGSRALRANERALHAGLA